MTQQVHNTVFISYRRSTSSYLARAIYMDLKQHNYDVFMDVQSIDSGQFDEIILRQIEARAHFLLLCTPGTFDRINDPDDWLRREIEHAMLHRRNIVPILASDFKFDAATTQRFTGKLAELPRYNAINVPFDYFEEALGRLRTRFLKSPVGMSITATPSADLTAVAAKQAEVESQPKPTEKQLTAEEYFSRGLARDESDYGGKIADYTEAIRLNPQYANAYYNRGNIQLLYGHLDAAIADFTSCIDLRMPDIHMAYNNRGIARKANSDFEGAIKDYDRAIGSNPGELIYYRNRGLAEKERGAFSNAIRDFERYIDMRGPMQYGDRSEVITEIRNLKKKLRNK